MRPALALLVLQEMMRSAAAAEEKTAVVREEEVGGEVGSASQGAVLEVKAAGDKVRTP